MALLREKPLGAASAVLLATIALAAILGPVLLPTDPILTNVMGRLQPPSGQHLLGTDELGRDVLSRLIHGARISLLVGFAATLLGSTVGALTGILSGYFGGALDLYVQRVMDVLLTFPTLVMALAIMAVLGASTPNVIIAIAIPFVPRTSRVMRSAVIAVKEFTYMEAAQALGLPRWRIIVRHLMPNCLAPYIIIATALLGNAIVVEASLSFLGLGVPPPMPSWGRSLAEALGYFQKAPGLAIFPGIAVSLVVFAANLLGDALRDIWDPRLKQV